MAAPVDIFREIPWVGGAVFHPMSDDGEVFRMRNSAAPGQKVPPHYHDVMEERFHVLEGELTFRIGKERTETRAAVGDRVVAAVGDRVVAAVGVVHSFENTGSVPAVVEVEFRPSADMPRMMAIVAGLRDDGESMWLLKYAYLERHCGLQPFSQPVGAVGVVSAVLYPVVMLVGRLARWDRLASRYLG